MHTAAKRLLGDAFIATSWLMYVALFLCVWAHHLPPVAVGFTLLGAVIAGHWIGVTWKRHVVGRTPVAAAWLRLSD